MLKKILLSLLTLVVVLIAGFITFVMMSWDKTYEIPYPDLQTSTDSAIIAHGGYLVNGPAHCTGCHAGSIAEMVLFESGTAVPLKGGVHFAMGPLGTMYPANLTPDAKTGIGRFSDGQIFRMMRHGVRPSGMASLPLLMPFWNMADDDIIAVVSYLRSLGPVENKVPDAEYTFLGKVVRAVAPTFKPITDPSPVAKAPEMAATIERGEYLAHFVANCVGCHTQRNLETFEAIDTEFAGGMEFEPFVAIHKYLKIDTTLWTRSPNITPYAQGALAKFKTKEEWIARFRQGRILPHSPMDWGAFSRMSDTDLEALYVYLNSLKPVVKDIGDITYWKE
ncbi:MAG: cytochrome c [Cyclobacteriaceae bacterium]|nr:cytochrome c [Cyclobacteriaceae bacterium]